jgi:hypothetical protein
MQAVLALKDPDEHIRQIFKSFDLEGWCGSAVALLLCCCCGTITPNPYIVHACCITSLNLHEPHGICRVGSDLPPASKQMVFSCPLHSMHELHKEHETRMSYCSQ